MSLVEELRVAQRVARPRPHPHAVLGAADDDAAAMPAVDHYAGVAREVDAVGASRRRGVRRLLAVGERRITAAVDHHRTVPPDIRGCRDGDAVLSHGEWAVARAAGDAGVR